MALLSSIMLTSTDILINTYKFIFITHVKNNLSIFYYIYVNATYHLEFSMKLSLSLDWNRFLMYLLMLENY
jgi:hypothetical protein